MVSEPISMASVAGKQATLRRAIATGRITLGAAYEATLSGQLPKGNALQIAEIAAIGGAKKTPDLIPLCHPLDLNRVWLRWQPDAANQALLAYSMVEVFAKTGVEMEALTAVSTALLTVWDLAKPIAPDLKIDQIRLLHKTGGKSGEWQPQALPPVAQRLLAEARDTYR
ncbi:MAG: cyclic pyranopterin monophosphate synthase MoaC [Wenzhouxiangellaceae bacterium]